MTNHNMITFSVDGKIVTAFRLPDGDYAMLKEDAANLFGFQSITTINWMLKGLMSQILIEGRLFDYLTIAQLEKLNEEVDGTSPDFVTMIETALDTMFEVESKNLPF